MGPRAMNVTCAPKAAVSPTTPYGSATARHKSETLAAHLSPFSVSPFAFVAGPGWCLCLDTVVYEIFL